MSDLKGTAVALWERLLGAMRLDGMIAHAITQTGPATTQIVLQLAHENMLQERQTPWIPVAIQPAATAEIWGRNFDVPELPGMVLCFSEAWGCWVDKFTQMPPRHRITHYILLPDIGKPLVPYTKPTERPEPEVL